MALTNARDILNKDVLLEPVQKDIFEIASDVEELAIDISQLSASKISYDNTSSGLMVDDVQGAIDEVEGNIHKNKLLITTTVTNEKTNAQHIGELKAVWATLTDDEKMRTYMKQSS